MKSALLFILLICTSGQSLAQSVWEDVSHSQQPTSSSSLPVEADIWEADDSVSYSAPAESPQHTRREKTVVSKKRVSTVRPSAKTKEAPQLSPRPIAKKERSTARQSPKATSRNVPRSATAPRAASTAKKPVKAAPAIARNPAPTRPSPTIETTQANLGFGDIPLNLRSGNYSTFFPNPRMQQQPEVCTDVLACVARSFPPSPAEQARTLAQIASIEALSNWKPPTPANATTSSSPNAYANFLSQFLSPARMSKILRDAKIDRTQCAKAVRTLLEKAGMVKAAGHPGSAKDYIPYLQKYGFRHNPNACNTPGVVRVYDKAKKGASYRRRGRTLGDKHGHVEILGADRKYHYFTSSELSIDQVFGADRRPLIGCMVKENWSAK